MAILFLAEIAVQQLAAASYDNVVRFPQGGYGYVPHLRGAYRSIESGDLFALETEEHGSRDVQRRWQRGAEGLDVVVVGNSFVDATALPVDKRFTSLLADGLQARVYNLGVQGQSLVNHVDRALYAENALAPDFVVLPVTVAADFIDTAQVTYRGTTRFNWTATSEGVSREITELGRGELLLRRLRAALRQLWLVRIGQQLRNQFMQWATGGMAEETTACAIAVTPAPAGEAAYRLVEALIEDLHAVMGERLLVLLIPTEAQVSRPADTDCDWDRPERWAERFSVQQQLRVVSLLPALRTKKEAVFYPGGHLNRRGHAVAAAVLANEIAPAKASAIDAAP